MELLLAIVVASAVIFFGALISMGNERQRKAIDGLREQVVLWAIQDLKIKREHLARNVQVPDPLTWFNNITSKIWGYDMKLRFLESFDEPQGLMFASEDNTIKLVFSPLSPMDIRRIKNNTHNRLGRLVNQNPLLSLPRSIDIHELSTLNGGILFDLELPLAWNGLTNHGAKPTSRIWIYLFYEKAIAT